MTVNGFYVSKISDLSLKEFVLARQEYCHQYHLKGCTECMRLISAAKCILTENVVKLQSVYVDHFLNKGSRYKSEKAVKRLMQLPVVVFPVKQHQRVALYVTESEELQCSKMETLIQNLLEMQETKASELSKATLSVICDLGSSEADKKLIKYTALLSSGVSSAQARKLYGISESTTLKAEVSQVLPKASEIQEAVNKLSSVKDKCILKSLGIIDETCSSDESQDESGDEESTSLSSLDIEERGETEQLQDSDDLNSKPLEEQEHPLSNERHSNCEREHNLTDPDFMDKHASTVSPVLSNERLLCLLRENELNWFSFVMELKLLLNNYSSDVLNQALLDFAHFLSFSDIREEEDKQIEQSRQAFLLSERLNLEEDINSDSESDDLEEYAAINFTGNLNDPVLRGSVQRKRNILKRTAKRLFHREIAERAILRRRVPPHTSKLLKKYPNLGKDIDQFVRDNRVWS